MDVQTLLILILAILTVVIVAVSVYVITVLSEFKKTLGRINDSLDGFENINNYVLNPATILKEVIEAVTETIKTVKSVRTIADVSDKKKE
jgi:predicted PurR-regulated permease PerM